MLTKAEHLDFPQINNGYNAVFKRNKLTLGLVVPIESYGQQPVPSMQDHVYRVQLAEDLGFSAVWLRDVPFNVPAFGDARQTFDPFVYLGLLAGSTKRIALGVSSIILPLRHPAHVAKAANSSDVLSGGRLLLGIASGDRPEEYPATNQDFDTRGQRFRESYDYIRSMEETYPSFENSFGTLNGSMDMLPKPHSGRVPLLVTGGSQQHPDWLAENGDGWMTYTRNIESQEAIISQWRHRIRAVGGNNKPVMQPLYIDLSENEDESPQPLHLGFRSGINPLRRYLQSLEAIGMNHVALNLRFNQEPMETTLNRLAAGLLPHFSG
ncbi:favin-dependent monooxygenase [Roseibium sp. TrichSKD4]|uniref:LLM class oxidoreductase n=1 Tax=Roseibium sp. TrichSKD4 TaxID=744980 RepID=UPI0001E563C1|nr:LLM class oxidoreductase [Roseibium sp. TrichSKD4]EFO33059.1 favin-dependent monooxygenase [Roseibium sp. TrichSKD4]